jgi:hypothetical protein
VENVKDSNDREGISVGKCLCLYRSAVGKLKRDGRMQACGVRMIDTCSCVFLPNGRFLTFAC